MSDNMVKTELFTELSDQQQELVSGGMIQFVNLNASYFASNTEEGTAHGTAVSGPEGSAAAGGLYVANQEIDTAALSLQLAGAN